jgi:hypothetical protein
MDGKRRHANVFFSNISKSKLIEANDGLFQKSFFSKVIG